MYNAASAYSVSISDTIPDVIHDAAQRPSGRQRSSIVDNSARRTTAVVDKLSLASKSGDRQGMVMDAGSKDRMVRAVELPLTIQQGD